MSKSEPEAKIEIKGGIGFLELLQIVFIVLKILDKITWSWLWVFAPTWIPMALLLVIIIISIIIELVTNN